MGMVVRTNTMALNAQRQLNLNNNKVSKSLEKLSSGFKINRAGDDAAGLAISERMKAQIKGWTQHPTTLRMVFPWFKPLRAHSTKYTIC